MRYQYNGNQTQIDELNGKDLGPEVSEVPQPKLYCASRFLIYAWTLAGPPRDEPGSAINVEFLATASSICAAIAT